MDLIYVPEILSYGSLRYHHYRDFDKPWNRDYYSYDNSTPTNQRMVQEQRTSTSKDSCQLCRESKRRSLAEYIRRKTRQNSCTGIHEEDEDLESQVVESPQSTGKKETTAESKRSETCDQAKMKDTST
ncbi:uncharacterized protein LOC107271962 [Cephus cinctus]|uniref:Uncharacterized protein LOC107271962 n=1 Tax=Cephus cinctus TaxID=211228 RepID=A0AAJ7C7V4_CEPCN|nr:uncharacterized protein LOC107271962 [Cephus cinctus]